MFLRAAYPSAFGADTFHRLFEAESFAEGRNIDEALAEWHAFGAFVFTCCLWMTHKDREAISAVLDNFQPGVVELLSGNEHAYAFFLEIVTAREVDYMNRYSALKNGNDLNIFYGRAVARITGDFSEDAESSGIPQTADIALVVALSGYAMDVMKGTTEAIRHYI